MDSGRQLGRFRETGILGNNSPRSQAAVPAPASPSLSAQVPSSPSLSVQLPEPAPSFGQNCVQPQTPAVGRKPYAELTCDQLHKQCTQRGDGRKDAKEVLKTRLASIDAAREKRIPMGNAYPWRGWRTRIFPLNLWEISAGRAIFTSPLLRKSK